MAFPLAPQLVDDLKSNFHWSYISQNEDIDEVSLEISVEDFLEYIAIDLEGTEPYPEDELVTLYYGMKTMLLTPFDKYFTYMLSNTERNGLGVIVNLGIIGDSDKYLLLSESAAHSAIGVSPFTVNKGMYLDAEIYSPYLDESMEINEFTNHPLSCSFPKETFRQFILENWDPLVTSLSQLKLVFQMGATYISLLNPDYKVQTAIIITKDLDGIRLDNLSYTDKPFKFKAMDVGSLCPPHCSN